MTDEPLTLDGAIRTALEYETRVRDLYEEAAAKATEDTGRRIFGTLAREEQGHLDYLNSRYEEWQASGKVEEVDLETYLPPIQRLRDGVEGLERKMTDHDFSLEIEMLKKARELESETGLFYKRMVSELDHEGKVLFQRFLEIEDAHYDIVQLQLDALQSDGFWFDAMEFSLEAG